MPIHHPPLYRYTLTDPWQKDAFELIKKIAKTGTLPQLIGDDKEKNAFLSTLIRTQKALHDWKNLPEEVIAQIKQAGTINAPLLNKKYPPESIVEDVPAWVTYDDDKIVSDFIDELKTRNVTFIGTDEDIGEFILRFILGQLGHDWEQTILMIWEMLGDGDTLSVKALNEELKHFDYTHLFE